MKNLLLLFALTLAWLNAFAQDSTKTMMNQGEERAYKVHLPNFTVPTQPVPLVIAMHGLGDTISNFSFIGFSDIGDTANFITVYPQASNLPILGAGWRIGTPLDGTISDVQFISDLIDTLAAQYPIDQSRVFATGFSMGGFMSNILGCELSNRITALASHSGTISASALGSCAPGRKVPAMHFHGTTDNVIAYPGGTFAAVYNYAGAKDIAGMWSGVDSCTGSVDSTRLPNTGSDGNGTYIDKFVYNDCKDSTEVIFYKITNFTHDWLFTPRNDLDATTEIWDFFSRQKALEVQQDTTRNPPNNTGTGILLADGLETHLLVYPNPTDGRVVVELPNDDTYHMVLLNMVGQQVENRADVYGRTELALHQAPKGLYVLQVYHANSGALVASHKLIKE